MNAAVVIVPFGVSLAWAVGSIAVTLAVWVLVSQWGAPKAKRLVAATALASVLAVGAVHGSDLLIKESPCDKYEPWSFLWIAAGCFLP